MVPSELSWILVFSLFVVISSSLLIIFYRRQFKLQENRKIEFSKKNVLVITAHPDDECMFFSPSILSLHRYSTVHLLCLSTGMFVKTKLYLWRFDSRREFDVWPLIGTPHPSPFTLAHSPGYLFFHFIEWCWLCWNRRCFLPLFSKESEE